MEGNGDRNSLAEVFLDSMKHLSDSSINGGENGELDHSFCTEAACKNAEFICLGNEATSAPGREVAPGVIIKDRIKMSREEWLELARRFQIAVSSHSWLLAESLIPCRDQQWLNDALCVTLDSVWFICTGSDVEGVTRLMKKLVSFGANDFIRAVLRTSFLASFVSVWRSRPMSLTDMAKAVAERLHQLEQCNSYEILKAQGTARVQKFTEWALKCVTVHSPNFENRKSSHNGEVQIQLTAFKRFLEMVGDQLTGKTYAEAFDAACYPLLLFSSAIDSCWASGVASRLMKGLLELLVEGGADNVNQSFLEASRFGNTELAQILLQIARLNSLDIDVNLALELACQFCKISTMEYLVREGNATEYVGPLIRAADRGCMQVVSWILGKGCTDMELCLALTAAISSCQIDVAKCLLDNIEDDILSAFGIDIIKAAGKRSPNSLAGVGYLMESNFLNDEEATYEIAEHIARSDEKSVTPELRAFMSKMWTKNAFIQGRKFAEDYYLNVARVMKKGTSPIRLTDLPVEIQVGIAYYSLYSECIAAKGSLLPLWLKGQLVEALWRLGSGSIDDLMTRSKEELVANLEDYLPAFLIRTSSSP